MDSSALVKLTLRTGISLFAIAAPAMAMAQRTDPGATQAGPSLPQPAPQSVAQTEAPAPDQGGVEDIVVTAQRRSENQQNVPISVTTITAQESVRTGITGTESLSLAVPGLQFSRSTGNGAVPFLRGVGSTQSSVGFEPSVAVYVDDVYIGSVSASLMSFNNIAQIEVLKGPQGTLFGRNATGGVVNIHTKLPSLQPEVDATVGYGNYNTPSGSLYASTGLTSNLAINFAASASQQNDGYGIDVNTGQSVYKTATFGLRSELLWTPGGSTKLLLSGDYGRTNSDAGMNVTILPGSIANGGVPSPGPYRTTKVPADSNLSTQYGASLKIDQDLGQLHLVSISAYRYAGLHYIIDNDATVPVIMGQDLRPHTNNVSQEFQLLSPTTDKLQWITGFFFFRSKGGYYPGTQFGSAVPGGSVNYSTQTLTSYSGFADVNYDILPRTKLTLGGRYTTDSIDEDVLRTNAAGVVLAPGEVKQHVNYGKFTYRAVLDYHLTHDIMVFGSVSRGIKSGGYNLSTPVLTIAGVPTLAQPVKPEVIDAFEVGLKTEFFDHKLRFNAAAFLDNYKNLQVTVVGSGTTIGLNAAAARIKGVDFDFTALPTSHLTISGGASFLDSKYTKFPNGPVTVPKPGVCTPIPETTGPLTGGNITCSADLSGNPGTHAPKFSMNLTGTYRVPTSVGDIALTGTFYHNSGFTWEPDARLRQPAYDLVNGTLSWTSRDGKYETGIWVKNLLNAYYYNYESSSTYADSGSPDLPRTFGVTFSFHFKP